MNDLRTEVKALFVGGLLSAQPLNDEMEKKVDAIIALIRRREHEAVQEHQKFLMKSVPKKPVVRGMFNNCREAFTQAHERWMNPLP